MIAQAIRDRLTAPEFEPFTLALTNGERVEIRHRDSVSLLSVEVRGRRFYASSLTALESREDAVIEHVISIPVIAKIVTPHDLNGSNGSGH